MEVSTFTSILKEELTGSSYEPIEELHTRFEILTHSSICRYSGEFSTKYNKDYRKCFCSKKDRMEMFESACRVFDIHKLGSHVHKIKTEIENMTR